MQNKLYFRLGVLVAGALLLLVAMMFYLGLADRFATRIHFVTTFRESVQGLTKGAAVKYKGVPIGSVDSISILTKEKLIRVDMSIDPKVFVGIGEHAGDDERLTLVKKFCEQGGRDGLTCRLDLAGVTGLRYVEMDYLTPEKRREQPLPPIDEPNVIYFPSVPSTFNNIVDSVGVSLEKIAKIDFSGISVSLEKNLHDLNGLLGDPALKRTIDRIDSIAKHIDEMSRNLSENLTGEELRKIFAGLNRNLEDLNELNHQLQAKLAAFDSEALARQVGSTLNEIRKFSIGLGRTRNDFDRTLQQLSVFLNNTGEFIEYLKADPNSLLRGKSAAPVNFSDNP